jgi:type I restriction enzyme S subunit
MQKSKAGYKLVKLEFGKEDEIPEDWLIQSIKDLGEIITGTTPSTSDKHNYGGDFPWATPPDLGLKKYVTDTQSK